MKQVWDDFFEKKTTSLSAAFLLGVLTVLVVQQLGQSPKEKVPKRQLSQIENLLRNDLNKIQDEYEMEIKLIRKKDHLVLRVWDDQFFEINNWSISKKGKNLVEEVGQSLQKVEENVHFEVSGHYDSVDPKVSDNKEEVNKVAITTHRAAQVAGILAGQGLAMEKIYIKGYGDTKPIFKDRDQYGQYIAQAGELNRRLEITVTPGREL